MKRIYSLLLLGTICLSLSATVKPRHRIARQQAEQTVAEPADNVVAQAPLRVGSQANAPLKAQGSPNIPVLLVQFSDLRFTSGLDEGVECTTQADIDAVNDFYHKFCNGDGVNDYYTAGGSRGAISEYFRDQSDEQFTPHFTVYGPVTLDKSYKYYGEDSGSSKDIHINDFYAEAIKKIQEKGIDWQNFDNDGNGNVDMVFFIYAGEGQNGVSESDEEAAYLIWPKEWPTGSTIGGVRYGSYACCNEIYNGRADGIGVFVHELSHALGLPDFYDYNYILYGMDYWDIMDSGCYCRNGYVPCGYSTYEKDFMGWKKLITLNTDEPQHLTLTPVSLGGDGYKIVNPANQNEYYVIENRQNKRWDAYISRGTSSQLYHGMLVTHVDFSASAWNGNRVNTVSRAENQLLTIIPADGTQDSYMYVYSAEDYELWMQSAAGDPFPGITEQHALEGEQATVHTTTGATPGLMNQPLLNITENADGTIELDYCPFGNMPDDIASIRHDDGTLDVFDLKGRKVAQTHSPTQLNLPAGIYVVGKRKVKVR